MKTLQSIISFLIYFVVNFLFLTKYGIRQSFLPLSVLCVLYIGLYFSIFYIRKNSFLQKSVNNKTIYIFVGFISVIYFVFCHLFNDPYKLNIDRWQTLNYSLEYWLQGKFFYDEINFMGNKSSYLPGQLLIALPFYLLGNVGYLQLACFLLFSYVLTKEFKSNYLQLLGIFMFSISLSYIYEVICKSDFISSFIVVASFIALWHNKYKDDYFQKPYLLGLILGILFLTRSVAVIPLIIFLLKPFLRTDIKSKIKVTVCFTLTSVVLLATVIIPSKDFSYIFEHNPLTLQGQSNKYIMLFFVFLAVILSFYVKKIESVFYFSSIIVLLVMVSFVTEKYFSLGYDYQNNYFSTTYLAACLPFAIIAYCFSVEKEIKRSSKID